MSYKYKNYSKFIATAATATLVATVIAPTTLAATFTDVSASYGTAVDYLIENEIAQGTSDTTFGTTATITRGDAAVMIANALKLDVTSAPNAGFTDLNSRVAGAVNALVDAKIVSGKTATTYEPAANITRQEMAKIIANAYELEAGTTENTFTDVNSNWDAFVDALVANKVTLGKTDKTFAPTASVTRGEFALFVYRSENLVPATPAIPEVISVTSANAKEIKVTFNHSIDADTTNAINVTTVTGGINPGQVAQLLSEDGKTLTFTATNFFKGGYKIAIPFESVKGTNGEYVKPVNNMINVNDTKSPVVTSATTTVKDSETNIKLVTLTFTENINSLEYIKIAGVNYEANTLNGNEATFAVDLDASQDYDVTVINAADVAGNVKDIQTAPLEINVDNNAPSITSIVATGENTLKLSVDKVLAKDLVVSGKIGTFNADVVSSVIVNPTNNKEYIVTLKDTYLYKAGNSDTVTFTVAKGALKDALGNENATEITKTAVMTKDATAPVVEDVENIVVDGNVTGFTVSYNEEVASLDTSKIDVVNAKGEIISFATIATAAISTTDEKQVIVTFKPVATGQYNFDFAQGFVTDQALSENESAAYSFSVDVTDATEPVETTFDIDHVTALDNVITVDFGEKVKATGSASALNPAAYELNGTVLPANTEIEFATTDGSIDQKKVTITLPEGFVTANDSRAVFRVTGVETLDNKENNSFIKSIAVKDNTAPEVTSFDATELDEITVTYSEAIVALSAAAVITDEIKLVDSENATVTITAAEVVNGKLVLTVADASEVTALTTLTTSATADIKDAAGVSQKTGVTINK